MTTSPTTPERAPETPSPSDDRRSPVEPSTPGGALRTAAVAPAPRFAAARAARVGVVGAAFLRARPAVVAPMAAANALILARSAAPAAQRVALGAAIATTLALFVVEALTLRRRAVGEAWLHASLALTAAALAAGCALSGGIDSPLLPLLLAPAVVAFAGFGKSRRTASMLVLVLGLGVLLALQPLGAPFPPLPPGAARAMRATSFVAALALAYAGVAGLVSAHADVGRAMDRLRVAALEEASSRMRATEQVGAKVAHELKNPLAAIKALLQLLAEAETAPRTKRRLDVALAEARRMETIVRDYLAFSRPLADLRVERIDLLALARDVATLLGARSEASGVFLEVAGAGAFVRGDPSRLREALLNLADNAVAATPRGGRVDLVVDALPAGARVVVVDTGAGLPDEIARAPGTPFVTTRPGGTGLGLVLARGSFAQHGGTLELRPREGGGTRAVGLLPAEPFGPLPSEG